MINLYIIVEGQSEEKFIKEILSPYFWDKNIYLYPERVITGKDRYGNACKGGGNSYHLYKNHIQKRIKQYKNQKDYYFTTMIDLYALPSDFPKLNEAKSYYNDKYKYVSFLEDAFYEDIGYGNFLPYIQLHEFETLMFCDIRAVVDELFDLEDEKLYEIIQKDIETYDNIELINDSIDSAPSKRLDRYTDGAYCKRKTTAGIGIIKRIDIGIMRSKCKHFNEWIEKIQVL